VLSEERKAGKLVFAGLRSSLNIVGAGREPAVQLPAVEVGQSPEDKFREYLASRPRPQRYTGQQRDLVRYIFSQHSHFDAEQLIDAVKHQGFRASRATVYRTLTKLVDAGLLRRLEMGPRTFYEHDYGYPQHDHLHCELCHKIIEFQHPAVEGIVREVCRQQGFQSNRHSLIVGGVCADCNRARVIKRRLDLV
jgi:Fur family ferric uptake transcriptional regulator